MHLGMNVASPSEGFSLSGNEARIKGYVVFNVVYLLDLAKSGMKLQVS